MTIIIIIKKDRPKFHDLVEVKLDMLLYILKMFSEMLDDPARVVSFMVDFINLCLKS